jgi:hypothetical protein
MEGNKDGGSTSMLICRLLTFENGVADFVYNHKSAYYFNAKMSCLLLINTIYIYIMLTLQTFFLKATPQYNRRYKFIRVVDKILSLQVKTSLCISKLTKTESLQSQHKGDFCHDYL